MSIPTRRVALCLCPWLLAFSGTAGALEFPVGDPQQVAGMRVAAVYLQAVEMAGGMPMRPAAQSDIHLEADVHALRGNLNGFAEGAWLPYLQVRFELTRLGAGDVIAGELMPMVASDGPHYGANVKLAGPGRYRLRIDVQPPDAAGHGAGAPFGRHVDRATGVQPWFRPFQLEWAFTYAGIGKKGGY